MREESIVSKGIKSLSSLSPISIIRPPNWTVRKKVIMERQQKDATPTCTANIDYHLDELAKEFKTRTHKGKSALIKKLSENPNNARFLRKKPQISGVAGVSDLGIRGQGPKQEQK